MKTPRSLALSLLRVSVVGVSVVGVSLLSATSLSAQTSTTRSIGNRNLGFDSRLTADTTTGSYAGATCENRLTNSVTDADLVRIDARFRRLASGRHDQRVRLYIGDTLLYYRNQTSARLIQENADESISSFATQYCTRTIQNTTGGEAGTGGSIVDPVLSIVTTIGARGQLMAASARNGDAVGADADFRTWAWCSSASVIGPMLTESTVHTTIHVKDRLWFSMQASPQSAGGTLYAMPNDNYVYQHFSATGALFPDVRRTPTPFGMIPIPYPSIFDESATLVNDSEQFPYAVFAVN